MDEEQVNEEIQDDDIRYQMACREARNAFSGIEDRILKPEYESFANIITLTEFLKYFVLLSVILILFFSKPEWCI